MAISASRFAPSAVVLTAVAYGVWPSAASLMSTPPSKAPEKVSEMPVALFSPTLPPPPVRDPFGGSLLDRSSNGAGKAAADTKAKAAKAAAEAAEARRRALEAGAKIALAASARKALQGFTLQAVSIVGDKPLAMIDDRLYAPGDTLRVPVAQPTKASRRPPPGRSAPAADASAEAPSYKILAVLPDKVLFEFQGDTLVLTYSDARSGAASPKGKRAAGKSGSTGGKSRGKSSSKKRN